MSTLTSRFLHYRTIRSVDVNLLISDYVNNDGISRGYIPNQTISQSSILSVPDSIHPQVYIQHIYNGHIPIGIINGYTHAETH